MSAEDKRFYRRLTVAEVVRALFNEPTHAFRDDSGRMILVECEKTDSNGRPLYSITYGEMDTNGSVGNLLAGCIAVTPEAALTGLGGRYAKNIIEAVKREVNFS